MQYHLHKGPIADPFTQLYRHQVYGPFDRERLEEGVRLFLGTHDFTSFANTKEKPEKDAVRTLYRLDIKEEKGGLRLEFEGDGFLYKMVRNIVGTLLDIAARKIEPDEIGKIFAARDRRRAGSTAPSKGLFLMEVVYESLRTMQNKSPPLAAPCRAAGGVEDK